MRDQLVEFKMPGVIVKQNDCERLCSSSYEIVESESLGKIVIMKDKKEIAQINVDKFGQLYIRGSDEYRKVNWVEIVPIHDGIMLQMGENREKPKYYAAFHEEENVLKFWNA